MKRSNFYTLRSYRITGGKSSSSVLIIIRDDKPYKYDICSRRQGQGKETGDLDRYICTLYKFPTREQSKLEYQVASAITHLGKVP